MFSTTGELGVLLLADARLPTGGHTQSGGLEPALTGGMPAADIPTYLTTRLRTATLIDAATAVVALHLLRTDHPIEAATDAWAARTPSHVVRNAAIELGRGYGRLLTRVAPDDTARRSGEAGRAGRSGQSGREPRPIVMARLAAELGLTARDLARVICHDDVQSICAAALKLAPLDPVDTVLWALAAAALIEQIVVQVACLTQPEDIPAPTAPAAELWQHAHANTPRRLFRA